MFHASCAALALIWAVSAVNGGNGGFDSVAMATVKGYDRYQNRGNRGTLIIVEQEGEHPATFSWIFLDKVQDDSRDK